MDSQDSSLRIVMFPWLAHGHIFPYLELAKRILTKKNFHIYLCSTPINFTSINNFLHTNSLQHLIEVIELHLHPHPDLPPHYHTTKNLPSHLNLTLVKHFQTAQSSFSHIITNLTPHLVIYDIFQPWAATIASSQRIPAVHFPPFGAAMMAYVHHAYARCDQHFPFPELLLRPHQKQSLDSLGDFLLLHVFDRDKDLIFVNYRLSSEVVLLKTSPSLEGKYIDYLSSTTTLSHNRKILPVGPLVTEADTNSDSDSDIMRWLGKKEQHSTVYVSFGSEYFLSEEEIAEIAKGLELCEANFIWVIRSPTTEAGGERISAVPEGFLERVRERGRVVTGWAPQAAILGHPSTGAFVSHCGWSSLNESIYYGVPVVGMPMKLNMFVDARMLVDAGACVEVEREGEGEGDGVYRGEQIAEAIDVVVGEERGERMRRRARELSEKMRREEEGAIDEVAHHLSQLCCKNQPPNYPKLG